MSGARSKQQNAHNIALTEFSQRIGFEPPERFCLACEPHHGKGFPQFELEPAKWESFFPSSRAGWRALYVASGAFKPGSIQDSKGRTMANVDRVLFLGLDCDLKDFLKGTGRAAEAKGKSNGKGGEVDGSQPFRAWPQEQLDLEIESFRGIIASALEKVGAPEPSAWINSGGGVYAVWGLRSEDGELKQARRLNKALAVAVNEAAGFKVCDFKPDPGTRVFRIPGTWHLKNPKHPRLCGWMSGGAGAPVDLAELEKSLGKASSAESKAKSKKTSTSEVQLEDRELLDIMFRSSNGAAIERLWNGDTSAHGNDHSAADQALCNHLASYWKGDAEAIDRLFRQSGLYRKKWERQDYRERTIQKAIDGCRWHYDPSKGNSSGHREEPPPHDDADFFGYGHEDDPGIGDDGHSGPEQERQERKRKSDMWTVPGLLEEACRGILWLEGVHGAGYIRPSLRNAWGEILDLAASGGVIPPHKREKLLKDLVSVHAGDLNAAGLSVLETEAEEGRRAAAFDEHRKAQSREEKAKEAERLRKAREETAEIKPYSVVNGGFHWSVFKKHVGPVNVQLTNWVAGIEKETILDDGASIIRQYEVGARVAGQNAIHRFSVPAAEFDSMKWLHQEMGSRALIFCDELRLSESKEKALFAVKDLLAKDVEIVRTYAHTGWREVDGKWLYLTAAGGIGSDGLDSSIRVDLQGGLEKYHWGTGADSEATGALKKRINSNTYNSTAPTAPVAPVDLESLRARAVQESLALMTLGPARIMAPVLGAAYRAPMGAADFSLWVWGDTGVFKTEVATLAQQHFGASWSSRGLPGSWSSTANALEASAFLAKDALFVADDFVARDDRDRRRLQALAQRFLHQAVGNNQGRARMRADRTLEESKPARGMVLSTGEDLPQGQSLRGRLVDVEVSRGDISKKKLTRAQQAGIDGLYSFAMEGYVQWMAGQYESIRAGWDRELSEVRDLINIPLGHSRASTNVAQLYLGWRYFLRYAVEVGAVSEVEAKRILIEVCGGLLTVAVSQARRSAEQDPVRLFLDCLKAGIRSGQAHLAEQSKGERPEDSETWGWRQRDVENRLEEKIGIWEPQGRRVGFLGQNDDRLILVEEEAFALVSKIARENARPLACSVEGLRKRLDEKGLIIRDGQHLRRKETVCGSRDRYLVLSPGALGDPKKEDLQTVPGEDEATGWIDPALHDVFAPSHTESQEQKRTGATGAPGAPTSNPLKDKDEKTPQSGAPTGAVPQSEVGHTGAELEKTGWVGSIHPDGSGVFSAASKGGKKELIDFCRRAVEECIKTKTPRDDAMDWQEWLLAQGEVRVSRQEFDQEIGAAWKAAQKAGAA